MNFKVAFFLCFCSVAKIKSQTPWYAFVNCFDGGAGVYCETPKSVISPYGTWPYYHQPVQFNHFPSQATIQPLPPNQADFEVANNQQPPTDARNSQVVSQVQPKFCNRDEFACKSPFQCIQYVQRCDGHVDCTDGSDEQHCPCVSRLSTDKLCDGFYDCPDGIDEMGCFGCKKDMYSCHSNMNEYIDNRQPECYSSSDKCNNVAQCSNGNDEVECLILSADFILSPEPSFKRRTEGLLFRSVGNKFYPVCDDNLGWAREVCQLELGVKLSDESISSKYEASSYDGKYVITMQYGTIIYKKDCIKSGIEGNKSVFHVTCPDFCGTRIDFPKIVSQNMRIAGGREAVQGSHPWIVSLYLNGTFRCGGSIIGKKWILTAAHCVIKNRLRVGTYDYLEARAGNIRRRSFTAQEQVIRVSRAVVHEEYDSKSFKKDIALLELSEPFSYNRLVRPICLPTAARVSNETDPNWMWIPENKTCLTAGWGQFTFRGPHSVENLYEVELPVTYKCDPNNREIFCAGYPEGGFDTCDGDSGGPFACRSKANPAEFYLLGITSAGYNPTKNTKEDVRCGEPGSVTTFTNTALYVDWIKLKKSSNANEGIIFRRRCPFEKCRNRCVKALDGIVDCLDGGDEAIMNP